MTSGYPQPGAPRIHGADPPSSRNGCASWPKTQAAPTRRQGAIAAVAALQQPQVLAVLAVALVAVVEPLEAVAVVEPPQKAQ